MLLALDLRVELAAAFQIRVRGSAHFVCAIGELGDSPLQAVKLFFPKVKGTNPRDHQLLSFRTSWPRSSRAGTLARTVKASASGTVAA